MEHEAGTDVAAFTALIEEHLGFHCAVLSPREIEELLDERLRATQSPTLAAYRAVLASPAARRLEVAELAARLSVGETYFFRGPRDFETLTAVIVPELARRQLAGGSIRVLSVGCSSGEEAYSLAISLQEALGVASARASIRGIDVCSGAIERARRAVYSKWALRTMQGELLGRHFRPAHQGYALQDDIRRAVVFEERNLFDEDPVFWEPGSLDVIFCRNVLMYFSPRRIADAVERFAEALAPGGHLFVGHSETMCSTSSAFETIHVNGSFFYRRSAPVRLRSPVTPIAAPRPPATSSRATLERATALFQKERFQDALAVLDRDPEARDGCADLQLLRAAIQTNQGCLPDAEETCRRVLALDPQSAAARYLLAICRTHEGELALAAELHRQALEIDPAFAMSHLQIGLLARGDGDRAAARASLRAALSLLEHEDDPTLALLAGGFSRRALIDMCRAELDACGGAR